MGYLGVATLFVTWAPFDFAWPERWRVDTRVDMEDVILNVIMFLPFGLLLRGIWAPRSDGSAHFRGWRGIFLVGAAGGCLSFLIEMGQLFLADRFTSPVDVSTNALGAALGALAMDRLRPRLHLRHTHPALQALDLPLAGLLLLLTPLPWLVAFGSAGSERVWLLLPLAAFGGALLGALHGGYLAPGKGRARGRGPLLLIAALWFLVMALPGAIRRPEVLAGGAALAVGGAWLRSVATERATRLRGERRVELPTLRMVLPLFALYLALSSLWPLGAVSGHWVGGWTLAPGSDLLSRAVLMRTLEYLGAFTLVGYISAELQGRSPGEAGERGARSMAVLLLLVLLLEGARGWIEGIGASGTVGILAAGAGLFGVRAYALQRAHVLALLGRQRPEEGEEREGVRAASSSRTRAESRSTASRSSASPG